MNKNFGGRKAGSVNKVTAEARQTLKLIFDDEISHLRANLETLSTKDRIDVLVKILPFILPKFATEININEQGLTDKFDFDDYQVQVLDGDGTILNTHTYKKLRDE
jgi:hypothetical protein